MKKIDAPKAWAETRKRGGLYNWCEPTRETLRMNTAGGKTQVRVRIIREADYQMLLESAK